MSKFKVGDIAIYKGEEVKVIGLDVWGNTQGVKLDNGDPNGMGIFTAHKDLLEIKPEAFPTVSLQEGRYYKTRDGRKVGPIRMSENWATGYVQGDKKGDERVYGFGGNHGGPYLENKKNLDIISEWQDTPTTQGPIREVRRREIVPGQWGIVKIGKEGLGGRSPIGIDFLFYSSEELREASHLLAQIAEVLDEGDQ